MDSRLTGMQPKGSSRWKFLQTVGASVPTLALMLEDPSTAGGPGAEPAWEAASKKFTPLDLRHYFNATAADFGPRERVKRLSARGGERGAACCALRRGSGTFAGFLSGWPPRGCRRSAGWH